MDYCDFIGHCLLQNGKDVLTKGFIVFIFFQKVIFKQKYAHFLGLWQLLTKGNFAQIGDRELDVFF